MKRGVATLRRFPHTGAMNLNIAIIHETDVLAKVSSPHEAWLVYQNEYRPGDAIAFSTDTEGFVVLRLEDFLAPTLVYAAKGTFTLPVPFGEKKICYPPLSFGGTVHYLSAREAEPWETEGTRDISTNPLDCHENATIFPHATANVETRGESVFAARCAVDGVIANHSHGTWPYASWGINRDPNAALTLEFGRMVTIEEIILYLRADFPHDAWWKQAKVRMDEGEDILLHLEKSDKAQKFPIRPVTTRRMTLHDLVKADDPSPFPALAQIRVLGREAR